jgi:hypothetical protein
MSCVHHPSAPQAVLIGGRPYCARCQAGIRAAVARLDPDVTPPDCFVWYANTRDGWQPIAGTGCAHYVSHQCNIHSGSAGDQCLAGFTFRVPVMLTRKTRVLGGLGAVRVGDIWANIGRTHTGLVSRIDPAPVNPHPRPGAPPPNPIIWITNASSGQHKLATDRFDTHFSGQGDFFR